MKFWKNKAVQSIICSLVCIILGLLIGFIVLLCIDPSNAVEAMVIMLKNFWKYSKLSLQVKYLGNTLVKTAPLLMCALSILFSYKLGLFNIGTAGQYVAGACSCLYAALAWGWSWLPCTLFAIVAGAVWGAIVGFLKSYCNVNEVISGIMLNWIALYSTNMILSKVKESASPYTVHLADANTSAILPTLGLDKLFSGNTRVTIAIPLSIILAVVVMIVLNKTKFGFELKATGFNKNAARYCGMAEKRNVILSLAISGGLAALGAAMLYLTDFEQWEVTQSSVPAMGFNGISAAFLGGLDPIGTILSSFFIQHITSGGANIASLYCSQISDLISSIIIYLCGFVFIFKFYMNKIIAAKAQKAAENSVSAGNEAKGGKA